MTFRICTALVALCVVALISCDIDSPERIIRAPVIKDYSPQSGTIDAFVGDTLTFSIDAIDPEDADIEYFYTMGGTRVQDGSSWVYIVDDVGQVDILGHAANDIKESTIRWSLSRLPSVNQPPVITLYQPVNPTPTTIVGTPVQFYLVAEDPEGKSLTYQFKVDDNPVSNSNQYLYPSNEIGEFTISCLAWDGEDNGYTNKKWKLSVLAEPDSIPPAAVPLELVETGPETGELRVRWRAVGDDGLDGGPPSNYIVKTLSLPIDDELQWSRAAHRSGEPVPAPPGELQEMVITGLNPADYVYVAVRAQDDFGNLSPLSGTLGAWVKGNDVVLVVRDALTGSPVEGINVRWIWQTAVSDAQGRIVYDMLPNGSAAMTVWDEDVVGDFGAYYDIQTPVRAIKDEETIDIWLIPDAPLETNMFTSFLHWVKGMTLPGGGINHLRNWNEPVDVYVPPYNANGLDFDVVIKDALQNWEDVIGMDLFNLVNDRPALGFYFVYNPDIDRESYTVESESSPGITRLGRINMRTHYTPAIAASLFKVASHEIGHAVGLYHSPDVLHLMIGGRVAAVNEPQPDEIKLVRIMYRMPRSQSMSWYLLE